MAECSLERDVHLTNLLMPVYLSGLKDTEMARMINISRSIICKWRNRQGLPINSKGDLDRFMDKVGKTENCWVWTGAKFKNGYGNFYYGGRAEYAHRASYMLFIGDIPVNAFICHKCDNKGCVNPDHLFAGDQSDNMLDCSHKNRLWVQKHPDDAHKQLKLNIKLSFEKAAEIRELATTGLSQAKIGRLFGVSQNTVGDIVHGRRWNPLAKIKELEGKG